MFGLKDQSIFSEMRNTRYLCIWAKEKLFPNINNEWHLWFDFQAADSAQESQKEEQLIPSAEDISLNLELPLSCIEHRERDSNVSQAS